MIPLGTLNDSEREIVFHLADSSNPLTPIVGHVFDDTDAQLAGPGSASPGAYVNIDHTRVKERGHGDYAIALTDVQAATAGVWSLYVNVAGALAINAQAEVRVSGAPAVLGAIIDPSGPPGAQTLQELINIIAAEAAGKAAGLDGPVSSHQALNTPAIGDRKNRIEATVIAGKRTVTKLDGTP